MDTTFKKAELELKSARSHFADTVNVPHSVGITKDPADNGYALKLNLFCEPNTAPPIRDRYHGVKVVIENLPAPSWK